MSLRRFLGREIPVWMFSLYLFLWVVLTAVFGWIVRVTADGYDTFGALGTKFAAITDFVEYAVYSVGFMFEAQDAVLVVPRDVPVGGNFQPLVAKANLRIEGLFVRKNAEALARTRGWRYLIGAFLIDGRARNAAVLLSPDLEIVHVWPLTEGDVPGEIPGAESHKLVHGFAVLDDGSMLVGYDGGISIQRIDLCGRRLWVTPGEFNHTISPEESGQSFWTIEGMLDAVHLVEIATSDGRILRRVSLGEIIDANPTLDILGIRQKDEEIFGGGPAYETKKWEFDRFHINDVEPLPAEFAKSFPAFLPGDLLISARSLDLIFVIDPKTFRIKWWISGVTRRQHDPDWQPNGEITVYDNNMGRQYSRIVGIAPGTQTVRVLFDGSMANFYSIARGKHQLTAAGSLLVTSPAQGRVFEVGPDGQLIFDLLDTKPNSNSNYRVTEAIWLPYEAMDVSKFLRCPRS